MHIKFNQTFEKSSTSGFTLLELLLVTIMMGALGVIAAPTWLSFTDTMRLNAAQNEIYLAMRQAQSQAKLQKLNWQASFREQNSTAQWAVHPTTINPSNASWNNRRW